MDSGPKLNPTDPAERKWLDNHAVPFTLENLQRVDLIEFYESDNSVRFLIHDHTGHPYPTIHAIDMRGKAVAGVYGKTDEPVEGLRSVPFILKLMQCITGHPFLEEEIPFLVPWIKWYRADFWKLKYGDISPRL